MNNAAGLYGQSLYDLAVEENLAEVITGEVTAVLGIFKENPDYVTLLSEPSIPRKERLALLDDAFGGQVEPYIVNFLKVLLEQGLLREFAGCVKRIRECYNRDHGITEAVVTSAVALTSEEIDDLKAHLEKLTGGVIHLIQKVDSGVLGGLQVEMNGRLLDGTVRGRLAQIRKKVAETVM